MGKKYLRLGLVSAGAIAMAGLVAGGASAAVVRVSETNFQAGAGLITFSEFAINTTNPTYAPGDYGGGAASPTVSFGGLFSGQSLSATPGVDCPGAAASACVVGSPSASLSLDVTSPETFITNDGSNPTSPVLSGSPRFDGPIALVFSDDQFGVGFDGGFFDAMASTAITAFSRDGTVLGSVANEGTGIEFLGLVSDQADIAGVFLDLIGNEPAGFAIDNLRFGERGQVIDPGDPNVIPLPAAGWLLIGALGGLGALSRRKTKALT